MLDLCAGECGWSKSFSMRGWRCVCVDLVRPREIPANCDFRQMDILDIHNNWSWIRWLREFDFICGSTPCTEFSTMRNFRPPVPYPELGIKLFNHAQLICEASKVPYILENVAGAGRYVGPARAHCGPYYLWGSGVPPILPQGIIKGMTGLAMGLREHKGKLGWGDRHGKKGQTQTALVATIPPELANCVCDYAERLCEAAGLPPADGPAKLEHQLK
jgi:hypothetical protein